MLHIIYKCYCTKYASTYGIKISLEFSLKKRTSNKSNRIWTHVENIPVESFFEILNAILFGSFMWIQPHYCALLAPSTFHIALIEL